MIICSRCKTKHIKLPRNGKCINCGSKLENMIEPIVNENINNNTSNESTVNGSNVLDAFNNNYKPKSSLIKPSATTSVNVDNSKQKNVYNIFGKKFYEGDEKECLLFLLKSFQINYLFADRLSKKYSDKFLFLVKNYYSQNDSRVKELVYEFSDKLDSYSKEEIFYMTFIYLFNHSICVIKRQGQLPLVFNSPVECASFFAREIGSRNEIFNKYHNVILYYLGCNDDIHSLSKRIYELTKKVTYVGYNYGNVSFISFGDYASFIDSLTLPQYIDEKRACIIDIFDFNEAVSVGNVLQNVLDFFRINSSRIETYLFNIMYAAKIKTSISFKGGFVFSNDEASFVDMMLKVKKTDNVEFKNFVISIFFMIKNNIFENSNFINIVNYKVNNQSIKDLSLKITSLKSLEEVATLISIHVVDREFKFMGKYLSIDKIADIMHSLSDSELIRAVKLFNQNELDKFLHAYGVCITKDELVSIVGELV